MAVEVGEEKRGVFGVEYQNCHGRGDDKRQERS